MNARSEAILVGMAPKLVTSARNGAAAFTAKTGLDVLFDSGYRTYSQQHALFLQGPRVTKADAGHGSHNFAMALDMVPLDAHGQPLWKVFDAPPNQATMTPVWAALVECMKAAGLEWGGDWKTMKGDFGHFYIGPADPNDDMRALYAHGGLQAVWAKYA